MPLKSQMPFSSVPKQENVNNFVFIGATYIYNKVLVILYNSVFQSSMMLSALKTPLIYEVRCQCHLQFRLGGWGVYTRNLCLSNILWEYYMGDVGHWSKEAPK